MSDIEQDGCSRDDSWDHLTPAEAYSQGWTDGHDTATSASPTEEGSAKAPTAESDTAQLREPSIWSGSVVQKAYDLLPCPHCGSLDLMMGDVRPGVRGGVACSRCLATAESVKAWNARATPDAATPYPSTEDERLEMPAWLRPSPFVSDEQVEDWASFIGQGESVADRLNRVTQAWQWAKDALKRQSTDLVTGVEPAGKPQTLTVGDIQIVEEKLRRYNLKPEIGREALAKEILIALSTPAAPGTGEITEAMKQAGRAILRNHVALHTQGDENG